MRGYVLIDDDFCWTFIENTNFRDGLKNIIEENPLYFNQSPDDIVDCVWENDSWNLTTKDLDVIVEEHIDIFANSCYMILKIDWDSKTINEISFEDI
jgi:hypothetical protein